MRHWAVAAILAAVCAFAFAGCGRHRGPAPGQTTLGMVTDTGGLGDRSFNDGAYRGLIRAKTQLGAYVQVLQSRSAADYQPNLTVLTNRIRQDLCRRFSDGARSRLSREANSHATLRSSTRLSMIPTLRRSRFANKKVRFSPVRSRRWRPRRRRSPSSAASTFRCCANSKPAILRARAKSIRRSASREVRRLVRRSGRRKRNLRRAAHRSADIIYIAAGKAGLGAATQIKSRDGGYTIGVDSIKTHSCPAKSSPAWSSASTSACFEVAQALHDGKPMHGHIEFGLKDGAIGLTDFQYTKAAIGAANLTSLARSQRDHHREDRAARHARGARVI